MIRRRRLHRSLSNVISAAAGDRSTSTVLAVTHPCGHGTFPSHSTMTSRNMFGRMSDEAFSRMKTSGRFFRRNFWECKFFTDIRERDFPCEMSRFFLEGDSRVYLLLDNVWVTMISFSFSFSFSFTDCNHFSVSLSLSYSNITGLGECGGEFSRMDIWIGMHDDKSTHVVVTLYVTLVNR